jgi:hypothetical protein
MSSGATLIKALKIRYDERIEIFVPEINAIAAAQMLKARASRGATGGKSLGPYRIRKFDIPYVRSLDCKIDVNGGWRHERR